MLRASLRSSRAFGSTPTIANAGRQWHAVQARRVISGNNLRTYTNDVKPSINNSKSAVLPGSASASTSQPLPPGPVATSPSSKLATEATITTSSSEIKPSDAPLIPPAPPAGNTRTASSNTPPLPPPPKPKSRFFRRFFSTLILLTALGYGGGLYYSRINDRFHDFFTEFVPFGEEAVLYFEEQDFKKRYPSIASRPASRPRDTGDTVKIPSQSGVSWKVREAESPPSGRHADATSPKAGSKGSSESKTPTKVEKAENAKEASETPADSGKATHPTKDVELEAAKPAPKPTLPGSEPRKSNARKGAASFVAPEVDEPSKFPPPITRIDPINIESAKEPVVQDLVKIINDIITVVNADNSNSRFSSTITKAKTELSTIGPKIEALKAAARKSADEQVKGTHEEFDRAAKELIRRLEGEMAHQEASWKEEYHTERQKLQESYEQKLQTEIERANEVNEQRLKNQLLEQALDMKRQFTKEVRDRVEEEREGRLGKLIDLSNTVDELEKLTSDWNSVVDANLKTQYLHVAVEAVRANLDNSVIPRPFIKELAALKEIASDDPVVNAAIASINPTAYQRGIPSSAQLIDRFRRVAVEVRKASLLPEEAGVASHASSYVLSKLLFKKKGLATGDDVESILTRAETLLEEGDLDNAAREVNALTGWAKTLSKDWLGEVRKVLEVQQALDVIATEARLQSLRVE